MTEYKLGQIVIIDFIPNYIRVSGESSFLDYNGLIILVSPKYCKGSCKCITSRTPREMRVYGKYERGHTLMAYHISYLCEPLN